MPLDFPASPSLNDTYTYQDRTWIWNGSAWILKKQINDTVIGNSTPSTGAFTTLSSTGNTTLGNIDSNVIPAANVTYNLGSNTARWNDIWLSNSTIVIGDANISADGGNLLLPSTISIGNAVITESGGNITLPAGTTIGGTTAGPGIPLISNVQITNSSWTVLDDTNINIDGGYIIVNGSGFITGAQVIIGDTIATSVSVVSSSVIRAQVPAKAAGSYIVYVVNPDGGTALLINGAQYSDDPNWVTDSPLISQAIDVAISLQLNASGATTYALQDGSTLPPGVTLSSSGLLSGTVTGVTTDTTYNFTLIATDAQLQDSPKAFSVTLIYIPPASLYVWGNNQNGELGLGDLISRSSPVQLGTSSDWDNISAGRAASATARASTIATKKDGTLWAWGNNEFGKLGLGNTIDRSSPVQVGSETNWDRVSISTGGTGTGKTVVMTKYNGTLWLCGDNAYGQLGLGNTIRRSSPTQVGTDNNWSYAISGSEITVGIRTNGTLWAWGRNQSGQLGLNDTFNRSSPVQVGTETNWSTASATINIYQALKTNGTLWATGAGGQGGLGLSTSFNRSSPTQVGTDTNWSQISVMGPSTAPLCAAIRTDGTLWTWGDSAAGMLGLNNTIRRSSPTQVGTDTDWKLITTGWYACMSIKTDNTLWAWGSNNTDGALGLNDITNRSSPVQVGTDTNWYRLTGSRGTRI